MHEKVAKCETEQQRHFIAGQDALNTTCVDAPSTLEAKQKLFSMAETEEIATTEMEVFSQTGAEIEVQ